jgi:hypothetical protein
VNYLQTNLQIKSLIFCVKTYQERFLIRREISPIPFPGATIESFLPIEKEDKHGRGRPQNDKGGWQINFSSRLIKRGNQAKYKAEDHLFW